MEGNFEDEKLDPSRCDDESVAKEGMKRRADEGQEEDVDGNRSRSKTLRCEVVLLANSKSLLVQLYKKLEVQWMAN